MQFTVSDPAAIAFAQGFYVAIAHGRSVDEATRSGRIGILQAPGTLEWVTPVLYVRGENTQLFQVDERARRSTGSPVRRKKIAPAPRPDKNRSSLDRGTAPARANDEDSGDPPRRQAIIRLRAETRIPGRPNRQAATSAKSRNEKSRDTSRAEPENVGCSCQYWRSRASLQSRAPFCLLSSSWLRLPRCRRWCKAPITATFVRRATTVIHSLV